MTFIHSFNSVRFSDASIYSDNAVFYLMGKAMLKGQVLYKDVFDHKTPYVYFINAIASLLGKNHLGLYLITVLVLFISLYFTYKIVDLIINDKTFAIISAAIICLFLNNANMTLGFLRTEGYVISLVLPSAYLFIKFLLSDKKSFKLREMFIIGVLAGLTLMINLKAAVLYVPFAFSVAIVLAKSKNYKNIFGCFVFGLLGVVLSVLPFVIYLTLTNSFDDAFDAIVNVNGIYSNYHSSIIALNESKIDTILDVVRIHPIITLIITLSIVSILIYKTKASIKYAVLLSYLFCLAYTIFLNRPYTYYYTIIIPFIIPICIVAYELSYKRLKTNTIKNLVSVLLVLVLFLINFKIGYFEVEKRYSFNSYTKNKLEELLSPHIKVDDNTKVLSYGFAPEYYIFLNSNLSFKYFIIPNIKYDYYDKAYLEQISYIKKAIPDVLIFSFGNYTIQLPSQKFNEFKSAVNDNYQYLGKLNIYEDDVQNPNIFVRK